MPAAAIIGAGVLGAGASIYGANKAASAAQNAANQNNALQRDIYNQNVGYETPWMNRGNAAGEMYNNAIGLGTDPQAAQDALATFNHSVGQEFTLKNGVNALTQNAAVSGLLNSGANLKNISNYGQSTGQQYFQQWLGNLNNQQQIGLSATNALAGIGTGYANAVGQNNNSAASATGNAALYGSGQINGLLGNALSAYGMSGGNPFASSYGGSSASSPNAWDNF